MAVIAPGSIEKFQALLQKDPNSQVFAPLAEAYRELKMLREAENTIRNGMKRHPNFVSGLVTMAKILRDLGKITEAIPPLKKAIQFAPENILAHQISAELYLANKQPKEALKSFKMVLFLNPRSQVAQKAIQKLESLTADEYDDDVFEMTRIKSVKMAGSGEQDEFIEEIQPQTSIGRRAPAAEPLAGASSMPKPLERMMSLIDAFIVRHDLDKARMLLRETERDFGQHPEILRRFKSLDQPQSLAPREEAVNILPMADQRTVDRKLRLLNRLLLNVESYRARNDIEMINL
jgi:tetratricopeptide (TPR) repeat protein